MKLKYEEEKNMNVRNLFIDTIDKQKEIAIFLIENRIGFTSYNGGLRAIVIPLNPPLCKLNRDIDLFQYIIKKFDLEFTQEGKHNIYYKTKCFDGRTNESRE